LQHRRLRNKPYEKNPEEDDATRSLDKLPRETPRASKFPRKQQNWEFNDTGEEEEETFTFRESRHCDEGREEAMNCTVAITNTLPEDANPQH
jgi:hypothetical protein